MIYTIFKAGDFVTRRSHNNDIKFKILEIKDNIVFLKGVDYRLYADAFLDDLCLSSAADKNDDDSIIERNLKSIDINRDEYFYLPGSILHIDADCFL